MKIIIKEGRLLNKKQETNLRYMAALPFVLGSYQSIDDILTQLQVDVIIEPGIETYTIPDSLEEAEKFWKEETERLEKLINTEDESTREAYNEARDKRDEIRKNKEQLSEMAIRGCYEPINNVIRLYPDEMIQEYDGTKMDELLVSTLAHETMHAYFDRPRHKKFPYIVFVEEPLAEFGMLLYLRESGNGSYYNWAYNDVSGKNNCYRYGAMLMDEHITDGGANTKIRKYLEAYKIELDVHTMPEKNGTGGIILPTKNGKSDEPVTVGGKTINAHWNDMFKSPPRYFYDAATNTVGLDGDWRVHRRIQIINPTDNKKMRIERILEIDGLQRCNVLYLGDSFLSDEILFRHIYYEIIYNNKNIKMTVSPKNRYYYVNKGILCDRKNNKPVLGAIGGGYYCICKNGLFGAIDGNLNEVVPCQYNGEIGYNEYRKCFGYRGERGNWIDIV